MVSKIIIALTKSSIKKDHRRTAHPRRKKIPIKSSSVVITTINESFFSCRRHLVKIFSKLVKIATPKRSPKNQGFKELKKTLSPLDNPRQNAVENAQENLKIAKALFHGLPSPENPKKFTIFLDLDETLIHSTAEETPSKEYDFIVRPRIEGETTSFYVLKRPWVDEFLRLISQKFEVVIFTAGLREYAAAVLDVLDKDKLIKHRLFRDSCRELHGNYVKDLAQMGRDLSKVAIIDDNPHSYVFQPFNAIQIKPFLDDLQDDELRKLFLFFHLCDTVTDIRDAVKHFALRNFFHS